MTAEIVSMPPLGLMYLASSVRNKGYTASIIDLSVDYVTRREFENKIKIINPTIIGITTFTECFSSVILLTQLIRSLYPQIQIVLGGPGVTFSYEKYLKNTEVDYILKGEGENSICELLDYVLRNKGELSSIKNLIYTIGDRVHINETGERISNLDELPWPDRSLIDLQQYIYPFTISTARGCPGNCIFCSSRQYWGKEIYFRSPTSIIEEIKYLYNKFDLSYFFIVDDTFTMRPQRVFEFIELLEKNNLKMIWGCESRADVVTKELLEAMHYAGCLKIQFGLESANNEILKKIGKGITKEDVLNAVRIAYSIGFDINISFIIGHAFDTKETIEETLDFALYLFQEYKVNPYCAINTPYPGTQLYDTPQKFGLEILTDNFDNYTMDNPIIRTKNFSPQDLRKYYQTFQDMCLGKCEVSYYQNQSK